MLELFGGARVAQQEHIAEPTRAEGVMNGHGHTWSQYSAQLGRLARVHHHLAVQQRTNLQAVDGHERYINVIEAIADLRQLRDQERVATEEDSQTVRLEDLAVFGHTVRCWRGRHANTSEINALPRLKR